MGEPDSFCRFFVEAWDVERISRILADTLGLPFEGDSTVADGLDIDVWANPYANKKPQLGTDWLVWPLTIEISADDRPVARNVTSGIVRRALVALWDADIRAVVACDFEDELPWSGGIARAEQGPPP